MGYLVSQGTLVNVWRYFCHNGVVVLGGAAADIHAAETKGAARYSTVHMAVSNKEASIPSVNCWSSESLFQMHF